MKTIEIEVALMNHLNIRTNIIVPNVSWAFNAMHEGKHGIFSRSLHECDLLVLSKSNYATEIEIKISKNDLLKDKEKKHKHDHNLIKYLYFAVPKSLKELALEKIPKRSGLYVIYQNKKRIIIKCERKAIINKESIRWSDKQRYHLAHIGAMRIYNLKKKLIKQQGCVIADK